MGYCEAPIETVNRDFCLTLMSTISCLDIFASISFLMPNSSSHGLLGVFGVCVCVDFVERVKARACMEEG